MDELPMYDQEQLNGLKVISAHSEAISEAWLNYAKAANNVVMIHEEFKNNPQSRSLRLAYQASLINLESAKAGIQEIKDLAFTTKINEWLP